MGIGRLGLRLAIGGLMIGHGTQKLFGWFGGHGLEATAKGIESLGLHPGKRNAIAAGAAETLSGVLLVLGFATPGGATILSGTMLTAIYRVHLKNGPWATNGGYEYNLVLIAAALLLAEVGPGPLSVDAVIGSEQYGPGTAAVALGLGSIGALAIDAQARKAAAAHEAQSGDAAGEPDHGDVDHAVDAEAAPAG